MRPITGSPAGREITVSAQRACNSAEETARRGDAIYESKIRSLVEPGNEGKVVAIDTNTEAFTVADTAVTASRLLLTEHPDAQPWIVRIGDRKLRRLGRRPSLGPPLIPGPVDWGLTGACVGICTGMLYYHGGSRFDRVPLDDSLPLLVVGCVAGTVIGSLVSVLYRKVQRLRTLIAMISAGALAGGIGGILGWIVGDSRARNYHEHLQLAHPGMALGAIGGCVIGMLLGAYRHRLNRRGDRGRCCLPGGTFFRSGSASRTYLTSYVIRACFCYRDIGETSVMTGAPPDGDKAGPDRAELPAREASRSSDPRRTRSSPAVPLARPRRSKVDSYLLFFPTAAFHAWRSFPATCPSVSFVGMLSVQCATRNCPSARST
jgi:hypothetical protein